jgi:hypothetical protein
MTKIYTKVKEIHGCYECDNRCNQGDDYEECAEAKKLELPVYYFKHRDRFEIQEWCPLPDLKDGKNGN